MSRSLLCLLALTMLALLLVPSIHAQSGGAFQLINDLASANRRTFVVYQDADAGLNKAFLSGFFGALTKIRIDPACIDDPANPQTGCATDRAKLDCARGTVLRVTWDPLASAETAGINLEDPQNYTAGDRGVGYNLTGATQVVFSYRSPTGIRVKFGVGTAETDAFTIPASQTWTEARVDFSRMRPSPPALADVHVLFKIVTDSSLWSQGGTLLLDDIRFEPAPARQETAASLPRSYKTCGVIPAQDPQAGRVRVPPDQANRNPALVGDAALALHALLRRATPEDLANARGIADALVYALDHDNNGLPLPKPPDGSPGWRHAYQEEVALNNDQLAPGRARAGDARLAGFSAGRNLCGNSGFCLVLDGGTGGANAHAILALAAAWRHFRNDNYLRAARRSANWIHGLLYDLDTAGYGGYFLGFPDGGGFKSLILSKSTVHNALISAAFEQLSTIERDLGNTAAADQWAQRSDLAGNFVLRMSRATGGFFAGAVPILASVGPGICNTQDPRGREIINTCELADTAAIPVLALAGHPRLRGGDLRRALQSALDRLSYTARAGGREYRGVNVAERPSDGPFGIALEYTGQLAAAMRAIDILYNESRFRAEADAFLSSIRQAQTNAPFNDGRGVVAAILSDADRTAPYEQCLSTPYGCIPTRVGLAATAWAIFAERGINPLAPYPQPRVQRVLHGFAFDKLAEAAVAPNTAFSIFGVNLGFETLVASELVNGALPKVLGTVGVAIGDVCAPLYYVSPTQINGLAPRVPFDPPRVNLRVYRAVPPGNDCLRGQLVASTLISLTGASPGLLTPNGRLAAFHGADGSFVDDGSPAARGEILTLYGTGLGAVRDPIEIGRPAAAANPIAGPVEVSIGDVPLPLDHICYAGLTPDTAGLYQLNVRVPDTVEPGPAVPVSVRVAGVAAQTGLTIPVGGGVVNQTCF